MLYATLKPIGKTSDKGWFCEAKCPTDTTPVVTKDTYSGLYKGTCNTEVKVGCPTGYYKGPYTDLTNFIKKTYSKYIFEANKDARLLLSTTQNVCLRK